MLVFLEIGNCINVVGFFYLMIGKIVFVYKCVMLKIVYEICLFVDFLVFLKEG